MTNEALYYVSPLTLVMTAEVYVSNYIWPMIAAVILAVLSAWIAFKLNSARDLGEGIIAAKPGRKDAKKSLLTPKGLARKLTRPIFIAWIIRNATFRNVLWSYTSEI